MIINEKKAYDIAFACALIGCFLILIGYPMRLSILNSIATWMILGSSALMGIFSLVTRGRSALEYRTRNNWILLFVLCGFSILFSFQWDYNSIVKLFAFMELPLYMLILSRRISKGGIKKWTYGIFGIYVLLCVYFANSPFAHAYRVSNQFVTNAQINLNALTMGYNNPNEASLYLLIAFIFVFSAVFAYRKLLVRGFFLIEALYVLYLIEQTESRATLLLALFILCTTFFCNRTVSSKRFFDVVFLIPIVFAIFLAFFPSIYQLWVVLGESFDSGRGQLFGEILSNMTPFTFLIGNYSRYGLANAHNAYISIFATFGFPALVAFVCIIKKSYVFLGGRVTEQKAAIVLFWGLVALVFYSAVEAFVFTSGSFCAASFFLLFVLYQNLQEEDKLCV